MDILLKNIFQFTGIETPLTGPLFLSILGIHILFGLACVLSGGIAAISKKGSAVHIRFGKLYFLFLIIIFITTSALSFMRWAEDYYLFILGAFSLITAILGRNAVKLKGVKDRIFHAAGMGLSFILLLTAFLVDNGKSLPVWNKLSSVFYWIIPGLAGLPLVLVSIFKQLKNRS